jgi:mevalonate kinase
MNQQGPNSFYSNGNLIISGEYFVLTGAKALAVPLQAGQRMKAESSNTKNNSIQWEANQCGKPWFNAEFNCEDLEISGSSDYEKALELQKILKAVRKLSHDFIRKGKSYLIKCEIDFNLEWGWGSSSTLIVNLAKYAGIDPFELNKTISSGSGYDIAASLSPSPVFYQLKDGDHTITPVVFDPVFKKSIWFLYLGRKQSTASGIEKNLDSVKRNNKLIPVITDLTNKIAAEENMEEFIKSIAEHEKIIAGTIKEARIKEKYFNDFQGEIKSLGAWGGDCAMVVSPLDEKMIRNYFKDKGLETIFRFDEIVRN